MSSWWNSWMSSCCQFLTSSPFMGGLSTLKVRGSDIRRHLVLLPGLLDRGLVLLGRPLGRIGRHVGAALRSGHMLHARGHDRGLLVCHGSSFVTRVWCHPVLGLQQVDRSDSHHRNGSRCVYGSWW